MKQFVMPHQFRRRTVTVCHDDYGHGHGSHFDFTPGKILLAKDV